MIRCFRNSVKLRECTIRQQKLELALSIIEVYFDFKQREAKYIKCLTEKGIAMKHILAFIRHFTMICKNITALFDNECYCFILWSDVVCIIMYLHRYMTKI